MYELAIAFAVLTVASRIVYAAGIGAIAKGVKVGGLEAVNVKAWAFEVLALVCALIGLFQ